MITGKKRPLFEAFALVIAATVCAVVANNLAARTRKLAWKAEYPNAMIVRELVPLATATPSPIILPDISAAESPTPTPTAAPLAITATPTHVLTVGSTPETTPSPTPAPVPQKEFLPHPDVPWVEIGYADVRSLYDRNSLFIDARRSDAYTDGHIAGARSLPVWEADIDERVKAIYSEGLDQEKPIVIYCSGGHCEDSHMLAQKLWGLSFNNVLVYKDGFPDWKQRRAPVGTGTKP